jgi:hypothetical protein
MSAAHSTRAWPHRAYGTDTVTRAGFSAPRQSLAALALVRRLDAANIPYAIAGDSPGDGLPAAQFQDPESS